MQRFTHVAVGGTFDHLHDGHRKLIITAFDHAQKVTIGLSDNPLFSGKKLVQQIEPYERRKKNVERYIAELNTNVPFSIQLLTDRFGTATADASMDAIVVTRETLRTAREINRIRQTSGLHRLAYIRVSFVKGNDQKIIRSGDIRVGMKDTHGNPYLRLFTRTPRLILPASLRSKLREPLGTVISGTEETRSQTAVSAKEYIRSLHPTCTICVGDVAYLSLAEAGYTPDIAVIDGKTQRKRIGNVTRYDRRVINPPGEMRRKAVIELERMIRAVERKKKPQILSVIGEEDLLTLPAILLAPLGSVVVYGQRGVGVVVVSITTRQKTKISPIIANFSSKVK